MLAEILQIALLVLDLFLVGFEVELVLVEVLLEVNLSDYREGQIHCHQMAQLDYFSSSDVIHHQIYNHYLSKDHHRWELDHAKMPTNLSECHYAIYYELM